MDLFVITGDDLSHQGGGITHLFETFEPMAERGHTITLFAPCSSSCQRPTSLNIRPVPNPCSGILGAVVFNLCLFAALLGALLKKRPAALYTRQLTFSCVPLLLAFLFRVKHCLEVNGVISDELKIIGASPLRLALVKFFARINCRFSHGISVTVKETAERLSQLFKVDKDTITLLPCNGANPDIFRPADKQEARQRLALDSQEFLLGFAGSLYSWHGVDLLLKALPEIIARVPQARVVIVGDGVEADNLCQLASQLKIEHRVTFVGAVPYTEVPVSLQAFDLGISFFKKTRPVPGIPMKMYEYMACGRPVIATDISGYGPIVAAERAGISVDSENEREIAEAVQLLYNDPQLREEMGHNGRRAVERKFNWQRISREAENFIQTVVGQ